MKPPCRKLCLSLLAVLLLISGGTTLLAQEASSPAAAPTPEKPVPAPLPLKAGVPEGFEQLSAPQETALDVYFGNNKIGNFRSIFTPQTVVFVTPEEIVNKIPALKHAATATVTQAITGELSGNTSKICGRNPTPDCGILKPEIAAVIFNENQFRVDLFVNPDLLELQDTHTDRILPPAPNIFSGVHQINGNITGTDSSQEFSVLTNSILAYGPQRLQFVGSASNQEKQVNTFAASLDKWGLDNQVGLFNSRPLQLLPQTSIAGISVGTSLKTNLALRSAAGSELSVFLPQRSYVSLIYNNIIYSTDLYDAGNQILNTSALPEGAYDVTIRVRSLAGVETEETRFFAKNFAIPPMKQPIYFGQVGTVRDTSETNAFSSIGNTLIATVGTVRRLTEALAFDTDLLLFKDKLFTEIGAFLLLPPDHQFRVSTMVSSEQDYGIGGSYIGYMLDHKLSFSTNVRAIFANESPSLSTTLSNIVQPVQGSTRQWSSQVSYQMTNRANIGFEANYSDGDIGERRYAYGPRLRYDFWRNGPDSLTFTASSANTESGLQQSVFLNLSMRFGDWGYSAQGGLTKTPGTGGDSGYSKYGDARVTWNNDKTPDKTMIVGAEVRHTDSVDSYITDLDHRSHYGNLKLLGSQTETQQGSNMFYTGNLGFSIAHTAHDFAWGGRQQNSSGFIFKNVGNSEDVPMKAMIDGVEKASFMTGDSTPIFLSPYQTYKVAIKPAQSSAIDYDGSVKDITLYPGNIMPLIWDINTVRVVLGHVILPDGTPLSDAKLEEARNISVTDSEGMFQGELTSFKTVTFKRMEETTPVVFQNQGIDDFALPPQPRSFPMQRTNMSLDDQRKAILELFGEEEQQTPAITEPQVALETMLDPIERLKKMVQGMFDKPGTLPAPAPDASFVVAAPVEPVMTQPVAPPQQVQATEGEATEQQAAEQPAPAPAPETVIAAPQKRPALRCRVILPDVKEVNGVYIYPEPLVCTPIADDEKTAGEPEKKVLLQRKDKVKLLASLTPAIPYQDDDTIKAAYMASAQEMAKRSKKPVESVVLTAAQPVQAVSVATNEEEQLTTPPEPEVVVSEPTIQAAPVTEVTEAPVEAPVLAAAPAPVIAPVAEAAPVVAAAPVAVASAPAGGIAVQVGSYRSESSAQDARNALLNSYAKLESNLYNIIRADLGSKGIYYRLRIRFDSKRDASDFCKELAAKGKGCLLTSANAN